MYFLAKNRIRPIRPTRENHFLIKTSLNVRSQRDRRLFARKRLQRETRRVEKYQSLPQ